MLASGVCLQRKLRFQTKCDKIFVLPSDFETQRGKLRSSKSGNLDAIKTSWRFVTDRDANSNARRALNAHV